MVYFSAFEEQGVKTWQIGNQIVQFTLRIDYSHFDEGELVSLLELVRDEIDELGEEEISFGPVNLHVHEAKLEIYQLFGSECVSLTLQHEAAKEIFQAMIEEAKANN